MREAQLAAANVRPRADELINDAKENISHAMRKESGSATRRVLRMFGYKFTPNPGETPEVDATPALVG